MGWNNNFEETFDSLFLDGKIKRNENNQNEVENAAESDGKNLEKSAGEVEDESLGHGHQSHQGEIAGERADDVLGAGESVVGKIIEERNIREITGNESGEIINFGDEQRGEKIKQSGKKENGNEIHDDDA